MKRKKKKRIIPNPAKTRNFESLSPFEKGYAVYMYGELAEFPDVPRTYTPTPAERREYMRGQQAAVQVAQDDP